MIAEALQHNRDLGASAARVLAAAAAWRGSRAAFLPSVDAQAGAARQKQVYVGLPIPGGDVLTSYATAFDAGFSASWEPDLWGRLSAGERRTEAQLAAQAAAWRAARLSVATGVAKAWYTLRGAQAQCVLAEDAVRAWQGSLDTRTRARRA
ncbi:MAG: TolC family protein [Planctomycetota bacterium]